MPDMLPRMLSVMHPGSVDPFDSVADACACNIEPRPSVVRDTCFIMVAFAQEPTLLGLEPSVTHPSILA